jgi:regulatory protein
MIEEPESRLPQEERAREICLRALERRMNSRRELELKLARKGVAADVASRVLDRLAEVGLVDDLAFARAFLASRQRSRPRGARGLAADLAARGVAREIVDRALAELEETEDPVASARRAVAAKLRALAARPADERRRKAEQFLLRRGFDYDTAREALRDMPEDGDD